MKKPEHIQVRVETSEKKALERVAAAQGRSLSAQVRWLIQQCLREAVEVTGRTEKRREAPDGSQS